MKIQPLITCIIQAAALVQAAKEGHYEIFKLIMKVSPDLKYVDRVSCTSFFPLEMPFFNLCCICNELHFKQEGWTALQAAACEGHKDIAQDLIYAGADVNMQHKVVFRLYGSLNLFRMFCILYVPSTGCLLTVGRQGSAALGSRVGLR